MADMYKGMSASQMATKIIKSGKANDSAEYIRDIASGPGAKDYMKMYIESEDLLHVFGDDFNKGGMVKSRTGPQDYRKGGMVLSTMDNRKNK